VLAWLAAAVLSAPLGLAAWLPVHLFLLGAVSTAIFIWSEHFAVAVLHARQPPRRAATIRLAGLNLGAVIVVVGRLAGWAPVLGFGATVTLVAVGAHGWMLWRLRRQGFGGILAGVVTYYLAAVGALLAGGAIGAALGAGLPEPWHARLLAAHLHLNILGWVLLTVLGTLFMLWPVLLRTTIAPSTRWALRWCLPLTGGGLAVAVVGLLSGLRPVAVTGLLGYVVGVAVAARPLVSAVRGKRPRSGAGWQVGAATCWLAGAVIADAVVVASSSAEALPDRLMALGPVLLVGVIGQVLIGSLLHLLPVVLGGGPPAVRGAAAVMERGWLVRLVALNAAVLLVAVPWGTHTVGWVLVGLSVADLVVRTAGIMISRRAGSVSTVVAGITAGVVLTMMAVVFAVSGLSPAAVDVTGTGVQEVEVHLAGMRIRPAVLNVAPGVHLRLTVVNEDTQEHDLRLANGMSTEMLDTGQRATIDVGAVTADVSGWCTVAGHKAAGMTMRISPATSPTMSPSMSAHSGHDMGSMSAYSAGFTPYPAALAPPEPATVHRSELHVIERDLEVSPGVHQRMWTFGGTVPGPTLRGRVGDVFEITVVNDGSIGHGIDFHAGALAPEGPMRTLKPGERLVYRFQATRGGAWLYHCSTAPLLQHVGAGMYGAVIIDPPTLPTVDREYVLVAGELYLGDPDAQMTALKAGTPDAWVFNGAVAGYATAPLPARVGERVRVWVVAAGPSSGVAFHVVGAQFDTVYAEGAWLLRPGPDRGGAQVLSLAPAQGGFVELTFPEPGRYPFVDHDLRHADGGATGSFAVTS